jgi:hypothetical protein
MAKFKKPKDEISKTPVEIPTEGTVMSDIDGKEVGQMVAIDTSKPICPRCKGDGVWHSTKTGVRALTSAEPLIDSTKPCPECGGKE